MNPENTSNTAPSIAIIGLGLIGGSLALAARQSGFAGRIIGVDSDLVTRDKALSMAMVDECHDAVSALGNSPVDMLILATPVNSFAALALECRQYLDASVTISDVGSTKQNLIDAFTHAYGELPAQLVPAHPIAGLEQSGIDAASVTLFERARVIILPQQSSGEAHCQRVRDMWESIGCTLVEMPVDYHDLVLAKTSHLPHFLSFVMVHYLASESENFDIFRFAAGGFRDLTRMAASDPVMWSSIFCANRDNMLAALDGLDKTISDLRQIIEQQDEDAAGQFITEARAARAQFANILSE